MYQFSEEDARIIAEVHARFDEFITAPEKTDIWCPRCQSFVEQGRMPTTAIMVAADAIVEPKRCWWTNTKNSTKTIGTESSMQFKARAPEARKTRLSLRNITEPCRYVAVTEFAWNLDPTVLLAGGVCRSGA
jgi:hypothetical protein